MGRRMKGAEKLEKPDACMGRYSAGSLAIPRLGGSSSVPGVVPEVPASRDLTRSMAR